MRNNKLHALLFLLIFNLISCSTNDDTEEVTIILGEWQLYKTEKLESIIGQFTQVDKWFSANHQNSKIFIEFYVDGTFQEFYADVQVFKGTWGKVNDEYHFDYFNDSNNIHLEKRRYVQIFCNNTYSIKKDGDDRAIDYYRKKGTSECTDKITYKVN
ncbi:MAG: hypothetical protein ACI9SI_000261 [Polaribacter sp.]|jgi:hypothetical protein